MTTEKRPECFALWCTANEIKRSMGGHPNDPAVDVHTVSTLRAMRNAVRQNGYLQDPSNPTARWKSDGTIIAGLEGLKQTLETGFANGVKMRSVWIDAATAAMLAESSSKSALDLRRAKACTKARNDARIAARRERRAAGRDDAQRIAS